MSKRARRITRGKTVWISVNRDTGTVRFPTYGNTIIENLAYCSTGGQGYAITEVSTGKRLATAPSKKTAERVCRVLGPHFTPDNTTLTKQGKRLYTRLIEEGAIVFQVAGHIMQVIKIGAMS